MADPNQRILWWQERIKQENKALVKTLREKRKVAAEAVLGSDPEKAVARRELAHRLKDTKAALAEERAARFRAENELRELEAVSKKAEEHLKDPVVVAKEKNSGFVMAATLK